MNTPELIARLRQEARFVMLPLLDSNGNAVGLHFHRFALRHVHVVQVWEDNYAVAAYLPNSPDMSVPLAPIAATHAHVGTFAEVGGRLVQVGSRHRHETYPDVEQTG